MDSKYTFYYDMDKLPDYVPTKDLVCLFKDCIQNEPQINDNILLKSIGASVSHGDCHDYISRLEQIKNPTEMTNKLINYLSANNSELIFSIFSSNKKNESTHNTLDEAWTSYNNITDDRKLIVKFNGTDYTMLDNTEYIDISNYPLLNNYKTVTYYSSIYNAFQELRSKLDDSYKIKMAPKNKKEANKLFLDSLDKENIISPDLTL